MSESLHLNHIKETCLYVKDLAVSRNFYEGKLGLKCTGYAEGKHIFFKAGSSMLLCFNPEYSSKPNELPPHSATGNIHLAFEVPSSEYESWKKKILDAGIEVIREKEWGGAIKSFYFRDPDGHLLEIVPPGMWE